MKYIKGKDGKFVGSVGEGRDQLPTTHSTPPTISQKDLKQVETSLEDALAVLRGEQVTQPSSNSSPAVQKMVDRNDPRLLWDIISTSNDPLYREQAEQALDELTSQRWETLHSKGISTRLEYHEARLAAEDSIRSNPKAGRRERDWATFLQANNPLETDRSL